MGAVLLWLAAFLAVVFAFATMYATAAAIDLCGTKLGPFAGLVAFLTVIAAAVATITVIVVSTV